LDRADLALVKQDVRLVEDGFLALLISYEVGRKESLVELHALDKVEIHAKGVRLFDRDNAILADLVDGISDRVAHALVCSRDRSDLGNFFLAAHLFGLLSDGLDRCSNCSFDAPLETHWVCASGHVAEALLDKRLGEHGCGGGSVASDVVGLGSDLFDELSAHVLERIFELNLASDGHTIVRDRRSTELLVENNVATLWAEGHLDGVSKLVNACFEATTSCVVELENLGHR